MVRYPAGTERVRRDRKLPVNIRTLRRTLGNFAVITFNRLLGRSFAPVPYRDLFVETSQRCNLTCRFCAYSPRGPSALMGTETFREVIGQAEAMNYESICLTPMLGDLFADPGCIEKFEILENSPVIRRFLFYTNFILAREDAIRALPRFAKLHAMFISVYGCDPDTFTRVTGKPARQYDKLIANLGILHEISGGMKLAGGLHFNIRTVGGTTADNLPATPMTEIMRKLARDRGASLSIADDFDTWGGVVKDADVADLGVRLIDGRDVYHRGACAYLFSSPQVMADGTVHACACRDVDGSLRLGHVSERPLREIVSWSNPVLRGIVEDHEAGRFPAVCRSCSLYRSIYDHRPAAHDPSFKTVPLAEAIRRLGG